jgi:uncharacterized protein (DUF697 family)
MAYVECFMQLISQEKAEQLLEWAYEKSTSGFPGVDTAEELADSYKDEMTSRYQQANSLIRFQNTKAATSGFVSGLGGLITLPVALPANVASVLFVQMRMIAAIAHLGGHDVRNDKVKTLIYSCLVASSAKDVAKMIGIGFGNKLAVKLIKDIPGKTIMEINRKVGFRLVTKFGQTGVVNLGKAVPLLGGIIGGSFDAYSTNKIGNIARDTFIGDDDRVKPAKRMKRSEAHRENSKAKSASIINQAKLKFNLNDSSSNDGINQ